MDRLVCGDVGFGKTEVAIRAAFKAVDNGRQVAVLVPTTILAYQHHKTFTERLKDFPVTVDYLNRFRTAKEKRETLDKLEKGHVDIIIGTHQLVNKNVKFSDLGLLIVDEEQKFGVAVKEKLKTLKDNVDVLTLTATPIPRTLQFSLMAARDLSVITTPPPNRYPIESHVIRFGEEIIRDTSRTYNINSIALRYFNPIGAHPSIKIGELPLGVPQNLIPFVTQTAAGIRKELSVFGADYPTSDGTAVRDYINVVDLAKAHIAALKRLINKTNKKSFEYFNIGTGKGSSVLEIINTFEKVNNIKLNYKIVGRREGDVIAAFADTTIANKELNWKTEISLEESLKSVWKWQQKQSV